jgi:hypothetical protein
MKRGRKKKEPDEIKRRVSISCKPENFEYLNAFTNKSKFINHMIEKFKKDNPDYLTKKLIGEIDF